MLTDCSTYVTAGAPADLDPTFTILTDRRRIIAEHVARRLDTDRGTIPEDLNYGLLVRAWLSKRISNTALVQLQTAIEKQAEQEETVLRCKARCTFNAGTRTLTIAVRLDDKTVGPFSFELEIGLVTPLILRGIT